MLELVNISNADCDRENLLQNKTNILSDMIRQYGFDGIEFMLCAPWDRAMYPPAYIKGVHLLFWPSWLDFWRGDKAALLAEFGMEEALSTLVTGWNCGRRICGRRQSASRSTSFFMSRTM